ncbi:caspase family protein [Tenacibaculum aiptasiae]|uniref:caspase family protein n=1 Tax=Tenacibaculum aiptasiae TaxID=426481 RepID=UPI003B5CCCA0
MARGISLHIGINEVDPTIYGSKLPLSGCVNDANDLSRIANRQGYETTVLLDDQATSSNITQQITRAARTLQNGDIFFISYSGHGSSIPNTTSDSEPDGQDESWVLYNRQFLDDELYSLWLRFKEGVRIFVLSDSCHSGTMLKSMILNQKMKRSKMSLKTITKNFDKEVLKTVEKEAEDNVKVRLLPAEKSYENYMNNQEFYQEIQYRNSNVKSQNLKASIILISGCQDHQFSYDYGTNGLFTSKVKETWNSGRYSKNYSQFHREIKQKVLAQQSDQEPNFMSIGKNLSTFTSNKPFIINAPGWPISGVNNNNDTSDNNNENNSTGAPRVIVPSTWNTADGIPEFEIIKGANNYYYIEIVNDEQLFDYGYWENNGNSQNSFFSWDDSTVSNRLTSNRFSIPLHVWNQLRESSTLYVRIGTTSSANDSEWDNHMVSESTPSMQIVSSNHSNNNNSNNNPINNNNPIDNGDDNNGYTDLSQSLSGSVGARSENKPSDVLLVQSLLNKVPISEGGPTTQLKEDGKYGSKTRNAIARFQRNQDLVASGRIEPDDLTFTQLKLMSGVVRLCSV